MHLIAERLPKHLRQAILVGLALLFAFASASSMIDKLQHANAGGAEHHHLLFSTLLIEADHAHDHHDAEHHDRDTQDEAPGHHHHADAGGTFVNALPAVLPAWNGSRSDYAREADPQVAGSAVRGLERPPKQVRANA